MNQYTETWKGICHVMGRSERWCRYMADENKGANRLPVFKVGGIVRLNRVDLDEWLERQKLRGPRTRSLTE